MKSLKGHLFTNMISQKISNNLFLNVNTSSWFHTNQFFVKMVSWIIYDLQIWFEKWFHGIFGPLQTSKPKSMCYQYNDKCSFGCTVLYIFITSIPLMFWYSVGKILWLLFSVNVQYVGAKQFSTISLLKKENWFLPNGNICISILSSFILVLPTLVFQRSYSNFEVK